MITLKAKSIMTLVEELAQVGHDKDCHRPVSIRDCDRCPNLPVMKSVLLRHLVPSRADLLRMRRKKLKADMLYNATKLEGLGLKDRARTLSKMAAMVVS